MLRPANTARGPLVTILEEDDDSKHPQSLSEQGLQLQQGRVEEPSSPPANQNQPTRAQVIALITRLQAI